MSEEDEKQLAEAMEEEADLQKRKDELWELANTLFPEIAKLLNETPRTTKAMLKELEDSIRALAKNEAKEQSDGAE